MKINGYDILLDSKVEDLMNNYDEIKYAPAKKNIFRALELTSLSEVKVVILGQDPYPVPGDACGLSFSVDRAEKLPKSLINIGKELESDMNVKLTTGDLSNWAMQGILLLNTVLTVEKTKANSHHKLGWQITTDNIIKQVSAKQNVIFVLLGKQAQTYEKIIGTHNIIIKAPHPSPLSAYRGFFGSKIFSEINNNLITLGKKPINW